MSDSVEQSPYPMPTYAEMPSISVESGGITSNGSDRRLTQQPGIGRGSRRAEKRVSNGSRSSSEPSSGPSPTMTPTMTPDPSVLSTSSQGRNGIPGLTPQSGSLTATKSSTRRLRRSNSMVSMGSTGRNEGFAPVSPADPQESSMEQSLNVPKGSPMRGRSMSMSAGGSSSRDLPVKKWEIEDISVEEKNKMRKLFHDYDDDKSGNIDAPELKNLLGSMGHRMSILQVKELLSQVDTDGNGNLDEGEFLQLVKIFKDMAQFRLYDADDVKGHINKSSRFSKILPDDYWMWLRDVVMCIVSLYIFVSSTTMWMGYSNDVYNEYSDALKIPDIIVTVPLAVEMGMRFFTSHQVDNKMTEDFRTIAKAYLRLYFWIDLLALFPMRLFTTDFTASFVLSQFRLLRLLRLPTHFETSNRMALTRGYINFHFVFVPAFMQFCYFIALVHVVAVGWFRMYDGGRTYSACVYMTLYFFSSCGFGDIEPQTNSQRWYAGMCCVLSLAVNALVVGNVVNMLNQADVEGIRRNRLVEMQAVLNFFDVPSLLQEEILQFQNHVLTRDVEKSFSYLIDHLPDEIKGNLNLQVRIELMHSVPLIEGAHKTVQIALSRRLEPCVFIPEWYIGVADEVGDEMYFVNFGFIDVYTDTGLYLRTLRKGDTYGSDVLLCRDTEYKHDESAKTLTYVETMVLTVDEFNKVMADFPRFAVQVEEAASEYSVSLLASKLTRKSDVLEDAKQVTTDDEGDPLPMVNSVAISSQGDEEEGHTRDGNGFSPPTYSGSAKPVPVTPPMLQLQDNLPSAEPAMLNAPAVQLLLHSPQRRNTSERRSSVQGAHHQTEYGAMSVPSALLQRNDLDEMLHFSADAVQGLEQLVTELLKQLGHDVPLQNDDSLMHSHSELVDEEVAASDMDHSVTPLVAIPSHLAAFSAFGNSVEQPEVVVEPPDSPDAKGIEKCES